MSAKSVLSMRLQGPEPDVSEIHLGGLTMNEIQKIYNMWSEYRTEDSKIKNAWTQASLSALV